MYIVVFIFVSLLVKIDGSISRICLSSKEEVKPRIGLFVSPIISRSIIHEIEIYWDNVDYREGDKVAIFTKSPENDVVPIYTSELNGPRGTKKTGLQAEFVPNSDLHFAKQCLKYHVAWLRDGIIKETNCLQTQPNWMHERRKILGSLTMSKVFLPGTHNSASYVLHARPGVENFIEKYAITQDVDILTQLIYGVRYLDIRVGHYPLSEEIWFTNHGIYRSVPLKTVLDQVKTFLDNTEEIVIFDVQEFPVGFRNNISVHHALVKFLEKEFAGYLIPNNYGWTSTLNSIWSSGKRLIIGYDEPRIVGRYESVWPCVLHQWGNVRDVNDLFNHLNRVESANRMMNRLTPRSAMAELTPNTFDVILNRLGGLRVMAESVNFNVTNWYTTLWQYSANIVAVDFVRSSGIIETAIDANEKRNRNCPLL